MSGNFRFAAGMVLLGGLLASPAQAEDCGTASACAEDGTGRRIAPIVVTGTRIASAAQADLEPRVTLDGQYLQGRNLTNIADALNEVPGFRGSVTPDGVQNTYGQGVNFVNLYRLGSSRTLTLVDGRRMVSSSVPTIFSQASPGSQVDLNAIPAILVQRIETIGIGGAPVHGSDAIAGTVNIILKRDFSGLELSATAGITQDGDNFRHNLSTIHGTDFADGRGHLVLAASHDQVDGVRQDQRGFYRDNVADVPNIGLPGMDPASDGRINPGIGFDTGPGDGNPAMVLARDFAIPLLTPGGLIVGGALDRAMQFDRAGNLVPFDRGTSHGGPFATGGDGYRLGDVGQITSDLERFSTHFLAGYDLSDRVRIFAEAAYFHSKADEVADQPDFNAVLFSGVSGPLVFPVTNPFLTDQARGLLLAGGYPAFMLSRANGDLGDPTGYAKTDQYRGAVGVDGSFPLVGSEWDFAAHLGWGRTDFTDPAVRTGYVNGHCIAFSGVQATFSYSAGGFSAAGNLFHVRRRVQNLTGASPQRLDGLIGDPEFQGQLRLRYDTARWGVGMNANYTGEQLFSRTNRGPSPSDAREIDELDAFITFDANMWFEPLAGLRANIAITNLLDRHGEGYFGYLIPASIDDPLGRRFSVNVTQRF